MSIVNQNIYDQFSLLLRKAKQDINKSKNKKEEQVTNFRIKALVSIIDIIKNYPTKIKDANELRDVKGIGKSSLRRIEEILKTGKLEELDGVDLKDKHIDYIEELEKIFGIGRKKALELINTHKITSIKELKKRQNKLNLPHAIRVGLKHYDKFEQSIPREEMLEIDIFLQKEVHKVDVDLYSIICGSYRRQKMFSNDIDLLIVHPSIKSKSDLKKSYEDNKNHLLIKLVKKLIKNRFIKDSLTGIDVESKYMGYCQIDEKKPYRRIDIRYLPYNSFYFAQLYFTGSANFNKRMRGVALDLGYKLNEFGLYDLETEMSVQVSSEKEIFDKLGMEYLEPKNRT